MNKTQKPQQKPQQKPPLFRRPSPTVLIAAGLFLAIGIIAFAIVSVKKPVQLSYAGPTCVPHLSVAPALVETNASEAAAVFFDNELRIGGVGVVAFSICFTPKNMAEGSSATVPIKVAQTRIPIKQFELSLPAAPSASAVEFVGQTIPTGRPLEIGLSSPDSISTYQFIIGEKVADCAHAESRLQCPIHELSLKQGSEYEGSLIRKLGGEEKEVAKGIFETLTPLGVTSVSVGDNEVVYDTRRELKFAFDDTLSAAEAVLELVDGSSRQRIDADLAVEKNELILTTADSLPRRAALQVTVVSAEGVGGASLADPLVRTFSTSGGPAVSGVSVGGSSSPVAGVIVFTFDQSIANPAQASSLITVTGAGASVGASGNRVTVSYSAGVCQPITVVIRPGFTSEAAVVQDQPYSFSTRTRCYTTSTIGTSEQGRAIVAYSFGGGAKRVLFHGALHGNERNTKTLMDAWIAALDANPQDIPAGTQIVVIPLVNPDGYAANTRTNSRNVDLNRNFDTTDWKTDVQTVTGAPFPGGGGSAPESEAESRVLANYTRQLSPTLTLSYHSVASYVIANGCGDSGALAASYASLSRYSNKTGVGGAFAYEITGTYDDWMCQRLGLRSILIELATSTSAEFDRNRAAMWAMVRS